MIENTNEDKNIRLQVRVDTYTRLCLTAIAVLLSAVILGLWSDGISFSNQADAVEKFPNSVAQRNALIKNQQETNKNLVELVKTQEKINESLDTLIGIQKETHSMLKQILTGTKVEKGKD